MEVSLQTVEIISGAGFVVERMVVEPGLMLIFAAIEAEAQRVRGENTSGSFLVVRGTSLF